MAIGFFLLPRRQKKKKKNSSRKKIWPKEIAINRQVKSSDGRFPDQFFIAK
jgi:hypothetical protein